MIKKQKDLSGENLGNYKIISKLGRGGMATVYKAHELSLNRIVALKVLSDQLSENPEFIKRFQREAQAAAALNHPNIVQIYFIGEEEGTHYFSMEYLKGKSLAEITKEEGSISYEKAIPIIIQVAKALREAHRIGLIHRDIKPSNIMIDSSENVKVTDFGIAYVMQAETKLTKEGSIIGTPEYLSPEQCEAKPVDGRSDIYSLGVTFYEILTGKTPYKADTPVSMLMKIVKGNFIPINEVKPDVPKAVQKIVEKMMNTKVEERYQNIDELLDSLNEIDRESIPSLVEHTKQIHEPSKKKESHALKNFFIAAIVIIAIIGGGYATWYFLNKDKNKDTTSPQPLTNTEQTQPATTDETKTTEDTAKTETVNESTEVNQTQTTTEDITSDETSSEPSGKEATTKSVTSSSAKDTDTSSTADPGLTTPKKEKKAVAVSKPKPPSNSVVVTTIGDEDKADIITSYVQATLSRKEFLVMDSPSLMNKDIKDIARFHLIVSSKHLASTTLRYYGNATQQYTVSITMKVVLPKNGKIIAGPFYRTVKYTAINAEENLREAVEKLTLEMQSNLKQKVKL